VANYIKELSRGKGTLLVTSVDGETEQHTITCCHCNAIFVIKVGSGTERGYCFMCNAPTCGKRRCSEECVPFMKRIEETENRARLRATIQWGCDRL
jgi:hypothetical protein